MTNLNALAARPGLKPRLSLLGIGVFAVLLASLLVALAGAAALWALYTLHLLSQQIAARPAAAGAD